MKMFHKFVIPLLLILGHIPAKSSEIEIKTQPDRVEKTGPDVAPHFRTEIQTTDYYRDGRRILSKEVRTTTILIGPDAPKKLNPDSILNVMVEDKIVLWFNIDEGTLNGVSAKGPVFIAGREDAENACTYRIVIPEADFFEIIRIADGDIRDLMEGEGYLEQKKSEIRLIKELFDESD